MSWHLVSFPDSPHCEAHVTNLPVIPVPPAELAKATLTSSPSTRSFVIRIHETNRSLRPTLALRLTPRVERVLPQDRVPRPHIPERGRRAPSSANDTVHWMTRRRDTREERSSLRVHRSRKPYITRSAKLALPASLFLSNKENIRFADTPLEPPRASVPLNLFSNEIIPNYANINLF